ERWPHAGTLDRSRRRDTDSRALRRRHDPLPHRPDRVCLRPHGDPVRHRRARGVHGACIGSDAAAHGVVEHLADLHRGSRGHRAEDAVTDAVIVGGGIAGLATAYELHRRGVSFVALERAPRPGGVILSEEVDGFTIDAGPDALLTQKADAIRLCEELGLGSLLTPTKPPRIAYVLRRGRLHPLPAASVLGIPTRVGPFIRTGLFSWRGKMRMGAELFVPVRRDEAE